MFIPCLIHLSKEIRTCSDRKYIVELFIARVQRYNNLTLVFRIKGARYESSDSHQELV